VLTVMNRYVSFVGSLISSGSFMSSESTLGHPGIDVRSNGDAKRYRREAGDTSTLAPPDQRQDDLG
jgi:hypothetical protein